MPAGFLSETWGQKEVAQHFFKGLERTVNHKFYIQQKDPSRRKGNEGILK